MAESAAIAEKSVLVLIPAFNEGRSAIDVAASVLRLGVAYRPLLIDDGSSDPIDPKSVPHGALFFRCPFNAGIGVATHIAFDHAIARDYDFVVRLDGDGQHPAERVPDVLAPLLRGDADLVAGIRTNHGAGQSVRKVAKLYYAAIATLLTGGKAPADVNTGFFAANLAAVRRLSAVELERFPEPQMYVSACRMGLRVASVEVEQTPRESGASTLNPLRALAMFYRFNLFVIEWLLESGRSWSAR